MTELDVAAFMQNQALAAAEREREWNASLARVVGLVWPMTVSIAHAQQDAGAQCPPCYCGVGITPGCSCPTKGCEQPYNPPDDPHPPRKPTDCADIPNHHASADGKFCIPDNLDNCEKGPNLYCMRIPILQSIDPNDKTPSLGFGPERAVTGEQPLQYAIDFENLPTASAAAQVVEVIDQLDTASLDLTTFAFGPIAIGDTITLVPPPGSTHYVGAADLRPGLNIIVSVVAHLDPQSGIALWTFTSLDPATGQLTDDPVAGFLPPNVSPPDGQGRVLYTVAAKSTVATGTVIKNKASIVFDVNAPIETPEVSNTIDKTAPESAVTSADVDDACDKSITVNWSGTDEGSSIGAYTVFVSVNGGPFTPWQEDTTATSAEYVGTTGNSYAFYSVARDIVGNTEAVPAAADVTRALGICGNENDLAITKLTAPKLVKLTATKPTKTVTVAVEIQNRSRHNEIIPDVATLAALVDVTVDSTGACTDPVATFRVPKKPKLITLKPAKKLKLVFDVTFDCANDPAKGAGHTDFSVSARVDHTALGGADAHPADDVCPRSVAPPGDLDRFPLKPVLDKGCGGKKPDKTLGAPVLVDVLGP